MSEKEGGGAFCYGPRYGRKERKWKNLRSAEDVVAPARAVGQDVFERLVDGLALGGAGRRAGRALAAGARGGHGGDGNLALRIQRCSPLPTVVSAAAAAILVFVLVVILILILVIVLSSVASTPSLCV